MKQMFNDQEFEVTPTHDHRQWYMTMEDSARLYGVSRPTIIHHLNKRESEIRTGIEKGVSVINTPGGPQEMTVLFREGVIKLGYFIRSPRAEAFRQYATTIVVQHLDSIGVVTPAHFNAFINKIEKMVGVVQQDLVQTRQEVDELRDMLNLFLTDTEREQIQYEINLTKTCLQMDGRTIIGKIKSTLNTNSVYGIGRTKEIVNLLRNLRGEGLKLLK